jgi:hypothetical protein
MLVEQMAERLEKDYDMLHVISCSHQPVSIDLVTANQM